MLEPDGSPDRLQSRLGPSPGQSPPPDPAMHAQQPPAAMPSAAPQAPATPQAPAAPQTPAAPPQPAAQVEPAAQTPVYPGPPPPQRPTAQPFQTPAPPTAPRRRTRRRPVALLVVGALGLLLGAGGALAGVALGEGRLSGAPASQASAVDNDRVSLDRLSAAASGSAPRLLAPEDLPVELALGRRRVAPATQVMTWSEPCADLGQGRALTDLGCQGTTGAVWSAPDGGVRVASTVLTMQDPNAADTVESHALVHGDDVSMRPEVFMPGYAAGSWRVAAAGPYVVVTVVTAGRDVPQRRIDSHLQRASALVSAHVLAP